jgi:hypothetical protein
MNTLQKIVLIIYVISFVFLSVIYVPFTAKAGNRYLQYYSSLWSPRHSGIIDYYAEEILNKPPISAWSVKLDTPVWALEISTLSIVCGTAFILLGKQRERNHAAPLH